MAALELADALVAIAENDATRDLNDALIAAADQARAPCLGSQPSYDGDPKQNNVLAAAPKGLRTTPVGTIAS